MKPIPLLVALLFIPFTVNAETIVVPAGGNLQSAVNASIAGDTIIITAGATYSQVVWPNKAGTAEITVRSSRAGELPVGVRVTPAQAHLMARIVTPNVDPALATAIGAHDFRFIGVEFTTTVNNTYSIVRLDGMTQTSLDQVPRNISLDRCWVHGQPTLNTQAGVAMNAAGVTVTNSHISDIHWLGVQSYGLGSFNGPGPFTITNNYIAAAGLNIIFGGSTPSIQGLIPSDITITGNHLHKPLEWKGVWTAVNLLELKSARRVVIADNLMENNWPHAQVGWAVIFNTFRDGGWEVIDDVRFIRNTIRNSTNGINLRGLDSGDTALRMHRIEIADNRLEGLGFGGVEAKPFQVLGGSEDVTINHNTVTSSTHSMTMDSAVGFKHVRLKFINNLVPHGSNGVFYNGGPLGVDAMNTGASDWQMEKNAIVAVPADLLSFLTPKYVNNYLPATMNEAQSLLGTDGLPVGVRTGSTTPTPSPTPSPSPTVTPTPVPTPTPAPSPSPSVTPTPFPSPTPAPPACSMVVVVPVMAEFSSAVMRVNVSGVTQPSFTITATPSSGQLTVSPLSQPFTSTSSAVAQFSLRSKRKGASVTVTGPCGSQVVAVGVR